VGLGSAGREGACEGCIGRWAFGSSAPKILGFRWTFARGGLVVDLAEMVVELTMFLPLLLLVSLLLDLVVVDAHEGLEESVSVEVGENVFLRGLIPNPLLFV
jgi:hypothetical protein